MPLSAMKPTPALMVNGMSRSHSAKTPPVTASGTQTKMSAACRKLPKLMKIRMKMSTSAIGTMMASRARAFCRFSNCPPNSK